MTFQLSGNGPEFYEPVMVPLWFGRWAEALVESADLQRSETVLDVACGTGVTTRLAKAAVGQEGRVAGLDINASMLAKAREIAGATDIEWIESDVVDIGLTSDTYDAILSQHGYHYFPDKPEALKEFRRLLKTGGRLAFSIWDGHSPYTTALCAAVERHISVEVAAKQRAQRQTPTADALRSELTVAGFKNVNVLRQELTITVPRAAEFVPLHLASMPIAGAFMALDDHSKEALIKDVSDAMAPFEQGSTLVYPDAVHVVLGWK
jgi:ubiquinone/menaquinone biosynthesis C-methylase UbiE